MARRIRPDIEVCTIAPAAGVIVLANGLRVLADYGLGDAPLIDVLVVTGGRGWPAQAHSPDMLAFIRRQAARVPVVSVCTGSMILAASGVLDGKSATSKREVVPPEIPPLERLRAEYPDITACAASLVDEGRIITGGGVSLCIDTMLYLLESLFGADMAAEVARTIEYQRAREANSAQFPPLVTAAARQGGNRSRPFQP
jgi:transcriptional regulator GlxA family with amidase domain